MGAVRGWLGDGRGHSWSMSAGMTVSAAFGEFFLFFQVSRKASSCLLCPVMRKHTGAESFATEVLDDRAEAPESGSRLPGYVRHTETLQSKVPQSP